MTIVRAQAASVAPSHVIKAGTGTRRRRPSRRLGRSPRRTASYAALRPRPRSSAVSSTVRVGRPFSEGSDGRVAVVGSCMSGPPWGLGQAPGCVRTAGATTMCTSVGYVVPRSMSTVVGCFLWARESTPTTSSTRKEWQTSWVSLSETRCRSTSVAIPLCHGL